MASASTRIGWALGLEASSLNFIHDQTLCCKSGRAIQFLSINNQPRFDFHPTTRSVKLLAVHSSNAVFAVGESDVLNPIVKIYEFPYLNEVTTISDAYQLELTNLVFSSGDYILITSGLPDYQLSIWNYTTTTKLVSISLPSLDLPMSISFNPTNWRQIVGIQGSIISLWTVEQYGISHLIHHKQMKLPNENSLVGSITDPIADSRVTTTRNSTRMTKHRLDLPESAIAGVSIHDFEEFEEAQDSVIRIIGTTHCWSEIGDVFIGGKYGELIKFDTERMSLRLLMNPATKNLKLDEYTIDREKIDKKEENINLFNFIAYSKHGIYAGGQDGVLRLIQLDNKHLQDVSAIQNLHHMSDGAPIVTLAFNYAYDHLALASSYGQVDLLTTTRQNTDTEPAITQILPSTSCGKFASIDILTPGLNTCVTVQEEGLFQIWNSQKNVLVGSLDLGHRCVSLASCPVASYAAVGTITGHLLLVDCTKAAKPRLILTRRLHEKPVKFIIFDRMGRVLVTASNDNNVILTEARPSKEFNIFGCVEFPGTLLDMSVETGEMNNNIHVTILSDADGNSYGNRITYFQLNDDVFNNPTDHYASIKCDLKAESINKMLLTHVNGGFGSDLIPGIDGTVMFTVDRQRRTLEQILLPLEAPKKIGNKASLMDYTEGNGSLWKHHCPNVQCRLSPDKSLLATFGIDGMLRLITVKDLQQVILLRIHDSIFGGTKQVVFAPDSSRIYCVGFDGGIIGLDLQIRYTNEESSSSEEYFKNQQEFTQITLSVENSQLSNYKIEQKISSDEKSIEQQQQQQQQQQEGEEGEEGEEQQQQGRKLSTFSLGSTNTILEEELTWIQKKQHDALSLEKQKYSKQKNEMKTKLKQIRETIHEMVKNNNELPDLEKLDRQEFELDTEEQNVILLDTDKVVQSVRDEIEIEMLAKQYIRDVLKKQCWDDMKVKGRSLCSFNGIVQVNNFPLKSRTQEELKELNRVVQRRKVELIDAQENQQHTELLQKSMVIADKDETEEDFTVEGDVSMSDSLQKASNADLLYNQTDLSTREQMANQTILLQDNIYRLKENFNKEFDDTFLKKEQEIAKIKDKNARIKKILMDLNLMQQWQPDPEFNILEKPERLLVVDDSEINVEKYLTPEQRKKLEEERLAEEERRRKEKADNWRERGLDEMMGGVLEVKKEDELKKEIPKPAFMLQKPPEEWNEEEKKAALEYERKVKELNEEREKFKKQLEAEYKKLTGFIDDGKTAFDDVVLNLFTKYIRTFLLILQDELKIWRLKYNLMQQEELKSREEELLQLFEEKKTEINDIQELLNTSRVTHEEYKDRYNLYSDEEKIYLDKGFKKEFHDVTLATMERLMKLLRRQKRNPTGQLIHNIKVDPNTQNPYADRPSTSKRRALLAKQEEEELQREDEKRPDDIEDYIWQRFCQARRKKRQHDLLVKKSAEELADFEDFLKKRMADHRRATEEADNIKNLLLEIENERLYFQANIEVQLVIKQGLVEVEVPDGFIHDFNDSLLLDRRKIEDLNEKICKLGEIKVQHMMEGKEFKKRFIHLDWELRRMLMEYSDLETKLKDIQRFKITREVQRYLNSGNYDAMITAEIAKLDKAIDTLKQHHEKAMQEKKNRLDQLTMVKTKNLNRKNLQMRDDLTEMNVTLNERLLVLETVDDGTSVEGTREKRYGEILQRQKLVDIAKSQAKEVAVLRAEVERLRMRTFPALVQNK